MTNRVRRQLIEDQWSDICRVAGTVQTRAATASGVIRMLQRSGQPTTLGRAIAELGRIVHTITMLAYVSDEAARRRVLVQLNEPRPATISLAPSSTVAAGICTRRTGPGRRISSGRSGSW